VREEHALVVAMELLRKQMADLPTQIATNMQRSEEDYTRQAAQALQFVAQKDAGYARAHPPAADMDSTPAARALKEFRDDPARKERNAQKQLAGAKKAERSEQLNASPLVRVMSQVAGKFAEIVGPAALLSQVLNNDLSGFQVLGSAMKVLASAIAPVLLPATVALSAGVLALSDVILEHGMPVMEKWFEMVLSTAIPAIAFIVDAFDDAADIVDRFGEAVKEVSEWFQHQVDRFDPAKWFEDDDGSARDSIVNRGPGERSVSAGLADTLRSLRMSMGPKATITGIGDVARQVQLAGLQSDPLKAREMKIQQDMLNRLDRIAANTSPRGTRVYDPRETGAGDYERGSGSASGGGDYGEGE
jgi:hypothetical protein